MVRFMQMNKNTHLPADGPGSRGWDLHNEKLKGERQNE